MTLEELIDAKLAEQQLKRGERVRSGKISPSFMGRCYRAYVWNRSNQIESNPPDARSLRVFECGKLFHNFIQDLLPEHRSEVKVETEDILGYADVVIDSEKTVWDIKSQHSKAFWYMAKEGYDFTNRKTTNILQVMTYVYLLGYEWGKLAYISKDDMCVAQYAFHIDQWKKPVENELKAMREHYEAYNKGVLPQARPRAYTDKDGKSAECGYCSYKDTCDKTEKGE